MIRKILTILSLIGLLLSVGLWVAQIRKPILLYTSKLPHSDFVDLSYHVDPYPSEWPEQGYPGGSSAGVINRPGSIETSSAAGYAALHDGHLKLGLGADRLIIIGDQSEDNREVSFKYSRSFASPYSIPLWFLALSFLLGAGVLVLVPANRRRKRKKLGLCLNCGYDLRGSQDRCPECGSEFNDEGLTK